VPTTTAPELLTAAKLADHWGVPKAKLAKLLKEEKVVPDSVKAGCSYYSPARLAAIREKLSG
jgi:hypothetical protein